MTELEKVICSSLNLFCFLNIWNEPESEYRVNIKPRMITEHSRSGAVIMNGRRIDLPRSNEPFYLYAISKDCFRNAFELPVGTWYDGTTLCNDYNILLQVYTEQGRMCCAGECYLSMFNNESVYILAVTKAMMSKLCSHENSSKIFVTIYKDSDIANKTTVYSYKIPTNDSNGTYRIGIVDKIATINDPSKIITYVNGYEAIIDSYTKLTVGDFVDIVYDENIIFNYTLDLDTDNYRLFYSEMDKMSKLLVHTPKSLNPTNKVITHNTCDFFLRRKKPLTYEQEGLYVHRAANISISQVTHQDYSVPAFIVDAYRDYLGSQDVVLRVIGRQHEKDNVLLRDKNYMDLLYTQSDAEIIKCLMGGIPAAPAFWKAANLEQSTYVKMMFDVPDTITPENMTDYVEGLGYYHTISLICQRVMTAYVTDLWGNYLIFDKPYLFKDKSIYPVLYHNGSKIHSERISVTNNPATGFSVQFLDNVYKIGDSIDIEMFLDGNRQVYDFTVTADNRSLLIAYDDYIIYQENNLVVPIDSVNTSYTKSYKKLTSLTNVATVQKQSNGDTKLIFAADAIGNTYVVQNKYCVRPLNFNSLLQQQVAGGQSICLDLTCASDQFRQIPIFEPQSIQIFLNGKYLIKNLDYSVVSLKDTNGNIAMHQIIIQNKSYLKGQNLDGIEVIVTAAEVEDLQFGFLRNDQIVYSGDKKLALWFNNISTSHIDGYMELDLDNQSSHINVPKDVYRQGAPYEISTNIPKIVKDFIDTYHDNDDYDRIQLLNNYFHGIKYIPSGTILLPYSHQIYSIYTNNIIHAIMNGTASISYDPDVDRLERQLKPFEYLKTFDLVFNNISNIDLTYVDVFPTFTTYDSVDPQTYKLIHAILKLIMPKDNFSSGEIPNV